jgi:hypothetical protein
MVRLLSRRGQTPDGAEIRDQRSQSDCVVRTANLAINLASAGSRGSVLRHLRSGLGGGITRCLHVQCATINLNGGEERAMVGAHGREVGRAWIEVSDTGIAGSRFGRRLMTCIIAIGCDGVDLRFQTLHVAKPGPRQESRLSRVTVIAHLHSIPTLPPAQLVALDASSLALRPGTAQCSSQTLPTLLRLSSLPNHHGAASPDFHTKRSISNPIEELFSMEFDKICVHLGLV